MPPRKYATKEEQLEARRLATRRWRARNPEKAAEGYRKWRDANREWRSEYSRNWRETHPERVAAWAEAKRLVVEQMRAVVDAEKSKPCADCGGMFPPVAMDLDHRDPTDKVTDVSKLAVSTGKNAVAKLLAEIEKCDVVCANCHRVRTARQNGWPEEKLRVPRQR